MAKRIPDRFLQTVAFLYPSPDEAMMGRPVGGSAFFVGLPSEAADPPFPHVYLVTNRHVIEPQRGDPALTIRLNLRAGGVETIETAKDEWCFPASGDDIAVRRCYVDGKKFAATYEPIGILLTDEIVKEYQLGIGDEVFSIGRFLDSETATENRPVVRFGQIAAMPPVDILATKDRSQLSYLVEMRSRSGFSGSAVYIYVDPSISGEWLHREATGHRTKNLGLWSPQLRGPWMLGVHWGQLPVAGPDAFELERRQPAIYGSGMSAIAPAQMLRKLLLEDEALKKARRAVEAEWNSRTHVVQGPAPAVEPKSEDLDP